MFRIPWFDALGPLRNLAATLAATIPFSVAVFAARRILRPAAGHIALVLGGALLLRLSFPTELLSGSDDAYRYLWDGLVQQHGINPYLHAPISDALADLRDPVFHRQIFRPDMRTVYPPLAELSFRLAYVLSPTGFGGLRLVLLCHELVSIVLLMRLSARHGSSPLAAVVYAWSPLAVIQSFVGLHLDAMIVPWLLAAVVLADKRPLLAGAACGASAMVRPLTALCLPALALRRPLFESVRVGLGFCLVCFGLTLLFVDAGMGLFESLLTYAEHWRFNGSLFQLFDAWLGNVDGFRRTLYAVVIVVAMGLAALPAARPLRAAFALAAYFALAPTVYPWYLLPLVALGVILDGPLMVLLPALISLSDLVFVNGVQGGAWTVPTYALVLEYLLIYGFAGYEVRRRWCGRGTRALERATAG